MAILPILWAFKKTSTPPKSTKNNGLETVSPSKHGVILGIYVRFRGVNVGKYIKYASPMDPSLNQATVRFQQRGTDLPQ